MDGLGGVVMVLKSGGVVEHLLFFFTELIAIQGMSKFVQQLDPLLSNLCRDDSRGRGLGDGVSGRG